MSIPAVDIGFISDAPYAPAILTDCGCLFIVRPRFFDAPNNDETVFSPCELNCFSLQKTFNTFCFELQFLLFPLLFWV